MGDSHRGTVALVMGTGPTKDHGWWCSGMLLLFGLLVGWAFSEVGLRLAGVSYPSFSRYDPDTGTALRPQAEGWWTREGRTYVQINRAGLRDRDHTLTKPPRTVRIAILGDSYAEALQVPLERTFWAVMGRDLSACSAWAGHNVEVLNFGVSGYGTAQELLTLRTRVWDYHPDLVLLAVTTGNDIRNNSQVLEGNNWIPYFVLQGEDLKADLSFREHPGFQTRLTPLAELGYRIMNASRVMQVINEGRRLAKARSTAGASSPIPMDSAAGALLSEAGLDGSVYAPPTTEDWTNAWAVTEALIGRMQQEVASRDARFLVATLSNSAQVHPDATVRHRVAEQLGVPDLLYPDHRIRALGSRTSIPVLTLAPLLQQYAEERQVFLHGFANSGMGIGHWNEQGHAVAGRLIAQRVCEDAIRNPHPAGSGMIAQEERR